MREQAQNCRSSSVRDNLFMSGLAVRSRRTQNSRDIKRAQGAARSLLCRSFMLKPISLEQNDLETRSEPDGNGELTAEFSTVSLTRLATVNGGASSPKERVAPNGDKFKVKDLPKIPDNKSPKKRQAPNGDKFEVKDIGKAAGDAWKWAWDTKVKLW